MSKKHRSTYRFAAMTVMAVLLAVAAHRPAAAHQSSKIEMTCPYDGAKFTFHEQISGTQVDLGLDLKPVGAIVAPWPIASCPTNGFVFLEKKYSDEELERLRPLIFSPEFQAIKEETPYYRASWILEHTGKSHSDVSWMLLRATWEAERTPHQYKRYSDQLAKRLPVDIDAANGEEKLNFQLIYAEVLRRLGRFDEAIMFLTKLEVGKEFEENVAPLIAYQRQLASQHDSTPHTMSESRKKEENRN